MRHWYVVFPRDTTEKTAHSLLRKWGAKTEPDTAPTALDGELMIPVVGPTDLPKRAEAEPGVQVYDNEARPGLT